LKKNKDIFTLHKQCFEGHSTGKARVLSPEELMQKTFKMLSMAFPHLCKVFLPPSTIQLYPVRENKSEGLTKGQLLKSKQIITKYQEMNTSS
jgi:hypothetical protein